MPFQISALDPAKFATLFKLSDAELRDLNAVRTIVDACPGTPCRISLEDARVGEEVILLNYQHQGHVSPYQASHAIFVRQGVEQRRPAVDEVPKAIYDRIISIRGFDEQHFMIDAAVATADDISLTIDRLFSNPEIRYIHLHNAGPGCFAAEATRA